jgi:hypothetical protein
MRKVTASLVVLSLVGSPDGWQSGESHRSWVLLQ